MSLRFPMMVATLLLISVATPGFTQQGAEACKAISRGIDRLACFDKAYGVGSKLAEPLPVVRVRPSAVRVEPETEIFQARPISPPREGR